MKKEKKYIQLIENYYDELVNFAKCNKSIDETIKIQFKNTNRIKRRDNIRSVIFNEVKLCRQYLTMNK